MTSTKQQRFISLAAQIATASPMLHRHGCVAVASGKIVGTGFNTYRGASKDGFIGNCCSCHAEIAAIRNTAKTHNKVVQRYSQHTVPKVV
jgi:tRNA(Arg) A34 adenosine deaminase TadA